MKVAVVGGGIAGLAAAWYLRKSNDVVVLEADSRVGGKIRTTPFAGVPVDEGADAFLARVPHAVELCRELGLDDLTSPGTGRAFLWTKGALHPIPEGLVLGVPADLGPLAASGLLSDDGMTRAAQEPDLPGLPIVDDISIGELVRSRFGVEVQERLVDPLLGGINAGRTEELSLDVGAAQLAAVAHRSTSLMQGLAEQRAAVPANPGPVFYAPRGGMERLTEALCTALVADGVELRCGAPVRAVEPGFRLHLDAETIDVDGVVLAAPAFVTAPLLQALTPAAADLLTAVDYASVVLVTLAYPDDGIRLDGSGFLVPRVDGRLLTACSWFTTKWPDTARSGRVILRASAGRFRDERAFEMDDDELVANAHRELTEAMGLPDGGPTEVRISRWPRAFPQFAPGHLDRIAAAERALPEGIALAGAALRGVGIPTCIGTARAAAERLTSA